MGDKENKRKRRSVSQGAKRARTVRSQAADAERQRVHRHSNKLIEWNANINTLETQLEAWKHRKGRIRTDEQNIMALQSLLMITRIAYEDADMSKLYWTKLQETTAKAFGMTPHYLNELR